MAIRRNQPKVHAKDLPVPGVTNSASFRPGEKRAISGAGTCGSMGTAMASARNPAIKPSTANRTKRSSFRWDIAVDSNRGFRGADAPSCGKISRRLKKPKRHYEFPAIRHLRFSHSGCHIGRADCLAARRNDAAGPDSTKAADPDD